jgi:hypothetical protein
MRFVGIALLTAMMCACVAPSKQAEGEAASNIESLDQALAEFQQHIKNCPFPEAHIRAFADTWRLPDFVVLRYVPAGVDYSKGTRNHK